LRAGQRLLAPGPYADAPQIVLSSVTGQGIDTLRQALIKVQREVVQRSHEGGFRLWIDRAFSVAGAGIVVTGTALSGQVAVGDTLMLGPSANRCGCAACMRRIKSPRSPWPASVLP
jgi:selenocysteine-specific elongation factor